MNYKALLAEVEMPAITRHWVDEYLSHLGDKDALEADIEEILDDWRTEFGFYGPQAYRSWRRKYA